MIRIEIEVNCVVYHFIRVKSYFIWVLNVWTEVLRKILSSESQCETECASSSNTKHSNWRCRDRTISHMYARTIEANCIGSTECISMEIFAKLNAYLINAWNNFYAIGMWRCIHIPIIWIGMNRCNQTVFSLNPINILCVCSYFYRNMNWTHSDNEMHAFQFSRKWNDDK